jgi:molybdenum cofactor cytidylyltransferase
MTKTGIIILAAGSSSRLGRPKQLLLYHDKPLIQYIVAEAIKAKLYPVIVVTGANTEQISAVLDKEAIELVYNEHWQEGMGSGIVVGISKLLSLNREMEAVIISVCDQPFLSAALFQELVEKKSNTGKGIIACNYADTTGTPVLFERPYFETLLRLKGEEGAKRILKLYEHDVATVPFPQGNIDIDTEEDYKNLLV